MTEYKWTIASVELKRQTGGLTDIVANVYWAYTAVDGLDKVSVHGITSLPSPDPNNFLPFSSLTQEQIFAWLEQTEDLSQLHKSLSDLMLEAKSKDTYMVPNIWQKAT